MNSIKEIDTTTEAGKYLMMSLAALTVSPKIMLNGKERDGRKMIPDQTLIEVGKVVKKVFGTQLNLKK